MTPSPDAERQRLEGLITPDLLLATDRAFMQAWRGSEGQSNEERGRLGRVAQIEVLVSALLAAPPDPAPLITTVVLANGAPVSAMCAVMDRCCYGESPDPAPGLREALTPTPDVDKPAINTGRDVEYQPCSDPSPDGLGAYFCLRCGWAVNRHAAPLPSAVAPAPSVVTGSNSVTIPDTDPRLERAHELCGELAEGTNGNVPIQSVYEAMLRLIGREDVLRAMQNDASLPPASTASE